MESVAKSSKMPASEVLSIVGGALMLAGGIAGTLMMSAWNQQQITMYGWNMGGMMWGNSGRWGMMMPGGFAPWTVGTMSALSIGAGSVLIAGGYAIYRKPESASAWGIGIVVASIVALFGMGGFFIGPILGIVGGVLALSKK